MSFSGNQNPDEKRVAIFASGNGTNAENIIIRFRNHPVIRVVRVFCNHPGAGVISRAGKQGVPVTVFTRSDLNERKILKALIADCIDFIVLAGFLWLIPPDIVSAYPGRIVNIHPALLPKYGGKGMYGDHVHRAVIASGDRESGITIHLVNEHYDEGAALFQARCPVEPDDTPEKLARRIHQLEYRHFPEVIEKWITSSGSSS
ncbi:MAG: phosphoribosylglycinamide formyltransferase [Bacteroidales bacterium]